MLPLGHVGTAVLLTKVSRTVTTFGVLGVLTPDLIDKPPAWILKVTPSGRYIGHSLGSCLLLTLALFKFFGRNAGLGFGLGYLAHLAGDIGGHVPWLMPLVAYEHPRDERFQLELSPRVLATEAAGLAVIVLSALHSGKGTSRTRQ